jgi:AmmeMemoRadiSam system protein A
MINKEDGKKLLEIARNAISSYFKGEEEPIVDDSLKKKFSEKQGAFVTITLEGELRGCIGFTAAIFPLWETIAKASQAAAFQDPRFRPLTEEEFQRAKIEISVLTKPEQLEGKPEDYPKQIKIGKHGLIVETEHTTGLLLPQVFTEHNADAEKALQMTCQKAEIHSSAWKEAGCKVYRFSAQVFKEE